MNIEQFREYCLSKKGVSEDFPFDETSLCFRVMGKIFAITDTEDLPLFFNLKCDPERAADLRERHPGIKPGWHMNKKHWNSVVPDEDVPEDLIYELIDHSYDLIAKSLKKSDREKLSMM